MWRPDCCRQNYRSEPLYYRLGSKLRDSRTTFAEVMAEQLDIPHPGSPAGHVTISLGVAAVEELTPETLPRLLETADSALYRAKERGRNRAHLAGEVVKKSACLAADDRL